MLSRSMADWSGLSSSRCRSNPDGEGVSPLSLKLPASLMLSTSLLLSPGRIKPSKSLVLSPDPALCGDMRRAPGRPVKHRFTTARKLPPLSDLRLVGGSIPFGMDTGTPCCLPSSHFPNRSGLADACGVGAASRDGGLRAVGGEGLCPARPAWSFDTAFFFVTASSFFCRSSRTTRVTFLSVPLATPAFRVT